MLISFFVRKIKSISFDVISFFFTFEKVSVLAYQFYHFPKFYQFVFYQFLLFFEFILVWNYQISCNFDKNSVFLRLIVHQFLENLSKSISSGYISLTGFLQVISFLSFWKLISVDFISYFYFQKSISFEVISLSFFFSFSYQLTDKKLN